MEEIGITKLSSKGQIVIPGKIRDGMKLEEGMLFVVEGKDDGILLRKIQIPEAKSKELDVKKIKRKILPILKRNSVTKAGIFGSYARNEQKPDSDIDILVEIPKSVSLLDFIGLKHKLEDILGKKVDLVEYNAVKPAIKDRILKEEIRIIEK